MKKKERKELMKSEKERKRMLSFIEKCLDSPMVFELLMSASKKVLVYALIGISKDVINDKIYDINRKIDKLKYKQK